MTARTACIIALKSESEGENCSVVSDSLRPHGPYSPWNSPGQNTGVGSLSLLQGIFPTQGSNPGLPYCRWILYWLSHRGSLRILEWVAYRFSSGSSWPRNGIRVSCIAGRFFTNWASREAPIIALVLLVSTVQQNESAAHIHALPPFWTSSHSGCHSVLSRVPFVFDYDPQCLLMIKWVWRQNPGSQVMLRNPWI